MTGSWCKLFSVILFAALAAGQGSECPPDCSSGGGLYPDPKDCTKFYECSYNEPFHMSCPSTLHFSPSALICDYPATAGCTADPTLDCSAVQTSKPSPVQTTRAPTVQTSQLPVTSSCVPPCPSPEALYPHPHDCTKYFHCARNVPYLKPCPAGQEYSGPLARCDWPEIAQCTANPDAPCLAATYSPEPTPSACKPSCPWPYAYMPHPQDCTKFYICDGQKNAFESSCQAGLLYSMDTVRCDYPELANCIASPENPCDAYIAP